VTAFLIQETEKHKIPCFGVLDYLIPKFETALMQAPLTNT
jgi:hypothetical protein